MYTAERQWPVRICAAARAMEFLARSSMDFLGAGGGISIVPWCAGSSCHFSLAALNFSEILQLQVCQGHGGIRAGPFGCLTCQVVRLLIAGRARMSLNPTYGYRARGGAFQHTEDPPLDADGVLLPGAGAGVPGSRDGGG